MLHLPCSSHFEPAAAGCLYFLLLASCRACAISKAPCKPPRCPQRHANDSPRDPQDIPKSSQRSKSPLLVSRIPPKLHKRPRNRFLELLQLLFRSCSSLPLLISLSLSHSNPESLKVWKLGWSVTQSVNQICRSICLCIHLPVCLHLSDCMSACLSLSLSLPLCRPLGLKWPKQRCNIFVNPLLQDSGPASIATEVGQKNCNGGLTEVFQGRLAKETPRQLASLHWSTFVNPPLQ